jgi:hypothetical protein
VGFCMMCILERHVARAATSGGAISPSEIVQNLRSMLFYPILHSIPIYSSTIEIAPGFRPGRQEDAHEFLRFVIEGAQKSSLSNLQKDKYVVEGERDKKARRGTVTSLRHCLESLLVKPKQRSLVTSLAVTCRARLVNWSINLLNIPF